MTILKTKPATVLKYLLSGESVTVGGQEFVLSGDNRLCIITTKIVSDRQEPVLLVVNMGEGISLQAFIAWAEKIPDRVLVTAAANAVLNNHG